MINLKLAPKFCLVCESKKLQARLEAQTVEFGAGNATVALHTDVPMYKCLDCGFYFMGVDGAHARDNAVASVKHLNGIDLVKLADVFNEIRALDESTGGSSMQAMAAASRLLAKARAAGIIGDKK